MTWVNSKIMNWERGFFAMQCIWELVHFQVVSLKPPLSKFCKGKSSVTKSYQYDVVEPQNGSNISSNCILFCGTQIFGAYYWEVRCKFSKILIYRIDAYKAPLLIKPPVQQNLNKPPLFWTKSPLFEAFWGFYGQNFQ